MSSSDERIRSGLWFEEPEPDNPFAAKRALCAGYDVFGDILGKASWAEFVYLLFMGKRPTPEQTALLNDLSIAFANPGPRDHSVLAAMAGGAGGSTHAASLSAALAVGAGQLGGAHEVARCVEAWKSIGADLGAWKKLIANPSIEGRPDIWPPVEHPPGFDPNGASCPTPVRQTLAHLASLSCGKTLPWLATHRRGLEESAGLPLAMSSVAAAALFDLGFNPAQAEMIYLILRLPGAGAHALEQQEKGWRSYPFYREGLELLDDEGN